LKSGREACQAVIKPKTAPVNNDSKSVKPNTRASTPISLARGMVLGINFSSIAVPQTATSNPAPPPTTLSSVLSVSNWRSNRPRPAPNAPRMAISFWRLAARARSKLATLAQAINNTNATAPSSTYSGL